MEKKQSIISFRDLEVYQNSYKAMISVMKEIVPELPNSEKYDLKDQLSRSCKAIPRLIAEGYAKRHQKQGFQKYLDDAMAETNETIVSLTQAKDLYSSFVDAKRCDVLIDIYDKISRQCYKLAVAWDKFSDRINTAQPLNGQLNEQRQR